MMQFIRKNIFTFFWIIALLDLVSLQAQQPGLHIVFKPLLLPILLAAVLLHTNASRLRHWLIAGFLFSFAGDIFLLFDNTEPLYFIAGLSSFLLTHIFYIILLLQVKQRTKSLLKKQPLLLLIVTGYCTALLYVLIPSLGDLKLPVMIYAIVIGIMVLCALHAYRSLPKEAGKYIVCGAICFIMSDTLLAIDRFYKPLQYAGVAIMLTYCMAQFLIAKGFIKMQD